MITENNKIENEIIYSDDKSHRYLLSRTWDKSKKIPLFITKSAGQADGIYLDLTTNIISSNLYKLGYGGFFAVNLVSAIDSNNKILYDKDTDSIIKKYAKLSSEIIIAWGTLTTKLMQAREKDIMSIIKKCGKNVLCVADNQGHMNVHPLTPSVRKNFQLADFENCNLTNSNIQITNSKSK